MGIKRLPVTRIARTLIATLLGASFVSDTFADIDWQPCEEMPDSQFQCANVYVPLNHQQDIDYSAAHERRGGFVRIALARLPASDSANKKGSLFLNPGGPGGSGVQLLLNAGQYLFTEEVRRNYDLIGFDPRGIGRSDELTCFENISEIIPLTERPAFPVTPDEANQNEIVDQYLSDLCHLRAGDLIDHMSTADVARDMDLLRQAVGDEKLHFAGYSYGSYLGVTYANLFPQNVGAMVIDGVLDPIAWSTGKKWESYFLPFSTRLRSAKGAQDSLHEFFRTCDEGGIEACALANSAESRYTSVIERIREEPIVLILDNGSEFILDYAIFVVITLQTLYMPESWSDFASFVAAIEQSLPANEITTRYQNFHRSLGLDEERPTESVPQPFVGFAGVACADTDNPHSYENWTWAAELSDLIYPYFGSPWTWVSSICHSWPGSKGSRYTGGFKVETENPVLIVNTLYDPSTPYHGARKANKLLSNSRLLTVNGWGHTSLFISECVNNAVSDYLLEGKLPEKGASCDPDATPFGASLPVDQATVKQRRPLAASEYNENERKELRRKVLKNMLPHNLR